jgi:hypothetical protein
MSWVDGANRNRIELTGEVRGTDLDGLKFVLRLPDGRKIPGHFEPGQEPVVLEALGEHANRRLHVVGEGEFSPEDGSLIGIVRVDQLALVEPDTQPISEPPIWERLAAIGADVPPEAWDEVPTDLASNVDRYLYGNKKDPH